MERLHVAVMDSNPRLQNGSSADSSTPDGFSDDVEAEANSYFHQMFSGHLTIDSMVQMLARFKESSVKRYNVNLYKAFASFGILLRVCLRLW
jgi:CCR4-NOT transcription complex subunit 1